MNTALCDFGIGRLRKTLTYLLFTVCVCVCRNDSLNGCSPFLWARADKLSTLCVCMCMCMCVCMCMCLCVCLCQCMYVSVCVEMTVWVVVRRSSELTSCPLCVSVCVCACVSVCVCMCMCLCVCLCLCMYVSVCVEMTVWVVVRRSSELTSCPLCPTSPLWATHSTPSTSAAWVTWPWTSYVDCLSKTHGWSCLSLHVHIWSTLNICPHSTLLF